MTSHPLRSITIGLVAVVASAGLAGAQEAQSGILNAIEVKQLIARGEPADHARLDRHFAALADQYAADAKRHNAMASAFIGSPSVRVRAQSSADHCKRLERLAAQSAATLRELATHHANLAAGTPSTAPKKGDRFEAGEGARVVEQHDKEMHDLAANARTAADHRAIEEYFESVEKRYNDAVNEHSGMARAYRAVPNSRGGGDPAAHCDRLVKLSREAAKEAKAVAVEHKQAATAAR